MYLTPHTCSLCVLQLQEKVKGVLNEIEELRAQKQHASAQIEQARLHTVAIIMCVYTLCHSPVVLPQSFQAQAQQFAELQALNKTLEVTQ